VRTKMAGGPEIRCTLLGTSSSSERLGGIGSELRSFLPIVVTHLLLRQERGRNMLKGLLQYADYFSAIR
jgi:hypothetical protein